MQRQVMDRLETVAGEAGLVWGTPAPGNHRITGVAGQATPS
jgi:hypothetical protein